MPGFGGRYFELSKCISCHNKILHNVVLGKGSGAFVF